MIWSNDTNSEVASCYNNGKGPQRDFFGRHRTVRRYMVRY